MKKCSKCFENKDESDYFYRDKKKGIRRIDCKECCKEYRKNYSKKHYEKYKSEYIARAKIRNEKLKAERQKQIIEYLLDKSCEQCGESDIRVLDFDHKDPRDKKFNISKAINQGIEWELILKEIEKCQILCANCHRKRTSAQFNWYKNGVGDRICTDVSSFAD